MIDAEQLSCFIAVAKTRSFVQAADQLGVVQSVVSKRLRRLEDGLGAPLVDRSNRRAVTLTRVGELFLDEARGTLARLEAAARVGQSLARGEAGPLRIGYVFSAAMAGLVTRIVQCLAAARPGIEVRLVLMETPDQLAALADGRLDIALTRPRPSYPPGTEAHVIHREGVMLALRSGDEFGGRARVSVAELAAKTFIVPQFKESVGLIEHVRALAKKGGFPAANTIETPDYISAASLAAAGLGLILAPASLQRLGLEGLSFVPIDDFEADFEMMLVRRTGVAPGLVDILLDEFAR
ncbi:LysR family transcriptional regulator [Sphingopyxis sp.]|uniref:LysR substrate-binding domain-containing protein n=1 Tax=Sphingopyxis sp. TaxID=1908224 RepID=UPI00260809FB|nr:LysR family transcriptional regulator [Sphingopyxis sp.]MCW0200078.1 LysR family transcriptional regulator [Sphingopyxis sp.]